MDNILCEVGCDMMKSDVRFIGYLDFYKKRNTIKTKYINFSREEKWIYKWYVYSRRQLKEYTCDLIWRFLNDDELGEDCVTETMLKDERYKYRM